jgi:hypothetical protein
MLACAEMCGKMTWHCANVAGDNDEPTFLRPAEDLGVVNGQRKVRFIPNAGDFKRASTPRVTSLERRPERSSQVLVKSVTQRHRLNSVGVDRLREFASRKPLSQLGHTRRVLAADPESINLSLVLSDIAIDFVSVLEIKHDHLVDERELQGGKLTEEHLGREPLIVIINEVIKPDPVSCQADFTVGVPVQAGRQ